MVYFEWTEALSVGDDGLDAQHKHLVDIINRLAEGAQAGRERADVLAVVAELKDYVDEHFAAEERYMRDLEYPDLRRHQLEHIQFAQEVAGFDRACRQGGCTVNHVVLEFLKNWLLSHIARTDRRYADYARQRG